MDDVPGQINVSDVWLRRRGLDVGGVGGVLGVVDELLHGVVDGGDPLGVDVDGVGERVGDEQAVDVDAPAVTQPPEALTRPRLLHHHLRLLRYAEAEAEGGRWRLVDRLLLAEARLLHVLVKVLATDWFEI